jgi:hypothetical protein
MRSIGIAVMACGIFVAGVTAQTPMRAGRWEVTLQMQMPGMAMPAITSLECVTNEQLKDPAKALPSASPGCTMSDYKAEGGKVTWAISCAEMTGTGEILVTGDTYEGQVTVSAPTPMAMKMSGKRVGDCTPE